jgi:hypothetical protein
MRITCSIAAALVVGCTAISAQTPEQRPAETTAQAAGTAGEITLIGCIQREADYRRQHDSGRGGVAGTGLGRGNEYILTSAMRMGSAADSDMDCGTIGATSGAPGEAYELTGESEPKLEPYVGRKVAVTGMLKDADTEPVGTSGSDVSTPTGGFDPLGQDLKLFELNVTSFSEVTAAPEPSAAAPAPSNVEPQPEVAAAPTTAVQEPVREELPRTASPLSLVALLGLLSLGGALTVRAFRN